MNRSLKLPLLIALALGSTQLLAVDLGQIQVKSALGQPLLAEIPVHAATPAELQHLTAQLASSDDFARAGIAGGRTTIPLHFSVADAAGGQRVIRITSAVAVEDPYLDLLIEVHAQAGKSVREFTILLDPPGAPVAAAPVSARQAQPVAQPAAAAQPQTPVAAAPARAQRATVPAEHVARAQHVVGDSATPAVAAADGKHGSVTVTRGQTLSSIARSAAPADVDIHQMLLAIKQANPEAFYRDNINALKTGAILRMPSATEAQTMAVAAAIAEVRRQNGGWSANRAVSPAIVGDTATRASASSAPTRAATDTNDRLALVPAKDNAAAGKDGSGAAGSKSDESAATLRRNLLRAQESLASVQQQTVDLKTRLKDLTDINGKNQHLLSLKDSEIAGLQAKLAAASKGGDAVPAAGASTTPPSPASAVASAATSVASAAEPAATSSAAVPAASGSAADAMAASPAATATTSAAVVAAPATSAAAAGTFAPAAPVGPAHVSAPISQPAVNMTPWYMQTWAWAAGAGAVVLLLLLALLGRRRKPAVDAVGKSASSLADRFATSPTADDPAADDVDQDELLDQLAEHPDDIGLHLELATLYYSRRDVEHFEAAAEAMHAHVTDPQQDEWQDVVHMGEDLVPTHPLFDHHAELQVHTDDDPLEGFDIDDYADDATVMRSAPASLEAGVEPPELPKPVGGYAFDFDLTAHPLPPELPSTPAALADTAASVTTNESDLPSAAPSPVADDPESSWQFEQTDAAPTNGAADDLGEFNDDPIDTKLDLARAYLDMGDAEGARAMLGEVLKEGSQMQQDVARELLNGLPH